MSTINCPQCAHGFEISVIGAIPQSQLTTMVLTHDSEMFSAKGMGEAIADFAKILIEIAKGMDVDVEVFVKSITTEPGRISVTFATVVAKGAEVAK